MPFEEVQLTTPDGVKIRAYIIPARRQVVPLHELRGLNSKQVFERGIKEQVTWEAEKDSDDAIEVSGTKSGQEADGQSTPSPVRRLSCSTPTPATSGTAFLWLASLFLSSAATVLCLATGGESSHGGLTSADLDFSYGLSEGTPSEHGECAETGQLLVLMFPGIRVDAAVRRLDCRVGS